MLGIHTRSHGRREGKGGKARAEDGRTSLYTGDMGTLAIIFSNILEYLFSIVLSVLHDLHREETYERRPLIMRFQMRSLDFVN